MRLVSLVHRLKRLGVVRDNNLYMCRKCPFLCPVDYRRSMVIKQNTMKKKMPQASPRLLHGTQSHWFFKIQIFSNDRFLQVFSFFISLAAAMRFAMVFSLSQVISGVSVRQQAASGLLVPHQSRISICFHPTGIPKLIPAVLRGLKSDPQHLLDLGI